jgi:hypothetical protein
MKKLLCLSALIVYVFACCPSSATKPPTPIAETPRFLKPHLASEHDLQEGTMTDWSDHIQKRLVPDEKIIASIEDVYVGIGFVPFGEPMSNHEVRKKITGYLALTTHRLIVALRDDRTRLYSSLGVYGLSERYFLPGSNWPYQAIVILTAGVSLVVQPSANDAQSAERLSAFLTKALFTLGKQESDFASMAAMDAYQRQREEEERQRRYD